MIVRRLPVHPGRRLTAVLTVSALTFAAGASGLGWAQPAAAEVPVEATSGSFQVAPLIDYPDANTPLSVHLADGGNLVPPATTLRLGANRRSVVGADAESAWLGAAGTPGWTSGDIYTEADVPSLNPEFDSIDTSLTDPADPAQTMAISKVVGPGTFSWYEVGLASGRTGASPPVAGGYRLGTGTQRDGSAQATTFPVPADAGGFQSDMIARFSAPGLYCVDFSWTAHPTSAGRRITATTTVRVAVGDDVPVDAACGTPGTDTGGGNGGGGGGNGGGGNGGGGGGNGGSGGGNGGGGTTDPNGGTGPTGNAIWTDGHVDVLHPTVEPGADGTSHLHLRSHDSTTRAYDDVVYYSSDAIKQTLPATNTRDEDYRFAGAPGQTVWNSPQDPVDGAPWAGLSTQDTTLAPAGAQPYQFRLDAVTGPSGTAAPGDVVIWVDGAEHGATQNVYASTRTGLPAGWRVPRNTHAHFNWTFSTPGVYCLAFTVEGRLADGTRQSDSQQLTMAVGSSVDPKTVTPCGLTQPYPSASAKPVVADTSHAPVLIENEATSFAPRLSGNRLQVGLRREAPYLDTAGRTTSIDDAVVHVPFGARPPYEIGPDLFHRGTSNQLTWDATGVPRSQTRGDITWSLSDVRGPGGVSTTEYPEAGQPTFDTVKAHTTSRMLWPGSQTIAGSWNVSRPGKYCLGMTWSVALASGRTVSDHHVLTLVVDGPLDPTKYTTNPDPFGARFVATGPTFTHTADTLTRTCAQGGAPTPGDGGNTGGGDNGGGPGHGATSGRDVLKVGHMDVLSTVVEKTGGNALSVRIHDDNTSPATIHDPARSTFYAAPGSRTSIPADARYRFLGASGRPVWVLPQTQDPALLWPGWNVDLTKAPHTTDVQWTLDSVKGPGAFALFENTGFGAVKVLLDSDDTAHRSFAYHEHAHANWAFAADGIYCLNSTFSARPSSLGASAKATLLVAVGDVDPARVTPADCGRTAAQIGTGTGRGSGSGGSDGSASTGASPTGTAGAALGADGTGGTNSTPQQCIVQRVTSRQQARIEAIGSGHFDFGSRVIDGRLVAAVKDGRQEPATWRDTAGIVFAVGSTARQTVPAGYGFLGAAGASVWVIPQTQVAGIPWLGWNTQDPSVISGTTGPVTFAVTGLTGPGKLAVYTTGSFGGIDQKVFGTAAGFPSSFAVAPNVHAHANWAFTAPGVYHLTLTQTATLRNGQRSSSAATLNFAVGSTDPNSAAPLVTSVRAVGHTVDGAACTPSASALASTGTDVVDGLVIGLEAVLVGLFVVVIGRRRRSHR